jgi:hypothetical protein
VWIIPWRSSRALVAAAIILILVLPLIPTPSAAIPLPVVGAAPCLVGDPGGEAQYEEGFEAGAPGWAPVNTPSRPNLWHWTTFPGNGTANDGLFHGGPGRLYYGIENAHGGTYNTKSRNAGEFLGPSVRIGTEGTYAIAINTKWHVEFDRPMIIDSMVLGYRIDGGARVADCYMGNAWAPYWNIPMGYGYYQVSPWGNAVFTGCEYALETPHNPCRLVPDQTGHDIAFDLAPHIALWEARYTLLPAAVSGRDIQVSLYFQTGDAIVDDAMGFMVDDVRILRIG